MATGIDRMLREMRALAVEDDPAHASYLLRQLCAEILMYLRKQPDDPLLLAYDLRDRLPGWFTYMTKADMWSREYLDRDSPLVPSQGAL